MRTSKTGKRSAFLLALVMTIALLVNPMVVKADPVFSDVKPSDWFYDYVMNMYNRGIVSGYTGTTEFRPRNQVTREHASKMIAGAAGLSIAGQTTSFKDNSAINPSLIPYIGALVATGAISGFPDNTFRPRDNILRSHVCKIVALAFDLEDGDLPYNLTDLPSSQTLRAAIITLASNGIVSGYSGTTLFKPNNDINRAELSKILTVAMAVRGVQLAEANPTEETIEHAQGYVDSLPDRDPDTKASLQERLDNLRANFLEVTFVLNGGEPELDPVPVYRGNTIEKPDPDPTREGYTFSGWFTDEELEEEFDFETPVEDNMTLYAKWEEDTEPPVNHTVTFIMNGGTPEFEPLEVEHGRKLTKPADPSRVFFVFDGWFIDEDCEEKYDFDDPVEDDLILYAGWTQTHAPYTVEHYYELLELNDYIQMGGTDVHYGLVGSLTEAESRASTTHDVLPFDQETIQVDPLTVVRIYYNLKTYTVVFNSKGGTDVPSLEGVRRGTVIDPPTEPTREGYTFDGWYLDEDLQEEYDFDDEVTENLTLFAGWKSEVIYHTVKFLDHDGTVLKTEEVKHGEGATAPDDPLRTGYSFTDWDVDFSDVTAPLTVTALYEIDLHSITYELYDGTNHEDNPATYTIEDLPLVLKDAERPGYDFDGWYDQPVGGELIEAITEDDLGDLTLHARWIKLHTVTFMAYNDNEEPRQVEVRHGESVAEPEYDERYGYTLRGWFRSSGLVNPFDFSDPITEDLTLYGQWDAAVMQVTLYLYDGYMDGPGPITFEAYYDDEYGSILDNEVGKTGYAFDGWFTEETGGDQVYSDTIVTRLDDHDLHARWTKLHTVTFMAYNDNEEPRQVEVRHGDPVAEPEYDERYGYTLRGWFRSSGLVNPFDFSDPITEDLTLYGQWDAAVMQVTLYLYDGYMDGPGPITFEAYYDDEYGSILDNEVGKTGYAFDGWFTEETGGDQVYSDTIVTRLDDHDLHARWEANEYYVSFHANGGDAGTMADQEFTYDEEQALTANAYTRTGFIFVGWNTAPDGTGQAFEDEVSVSNLTDEPDGEVNLYAQWIVDKFTVRFLPNGGMGSMEDQEFTYGEAQSLRPNAYSMALYTFMGWNTAADGTGTAYANGESLNIPTPVPDGLVVLYAQWRGNPYTVTFDANGGEAADPPSKVVYYQDTYGSLPSSKRSGFNGVAYRFDGWWTQASGGERKLVTSVVTATADHTLYGHWPEAFNVKRINRAASPPDDWGRIIFTKDPDVTLGTTALQILKNDTDWHQHGDFDFQVEGTWPDIMTMISFERALSGGGSERYRMMDISGGTAYPGSFEGNFTINIRLHSNHDASVSFNARFYRGAVPDWVHTEITGIPDN